MIIYNWGGGGGGGICICREDVGWTGGDQYDY